MLNSLIDVFGLAGYMNTILTASVAGLLTGHILQRWFGFFIVLVIAASRIPFIRSRLT